MAIESKWEAVPPQTILSNGTSAGAISVPDTSLFKVKQKVTLFSDSSSPVEMEVKRVPSPTVMFLGLVGKPIHQYADLSSFTIADNTRISAPEQPRPAIPPDAYERATYEEEPVMAKRSVLVDKHGRKYDENNPLPTTAQLNLEGDLNLDTDGFDLTNPDSILIVGTEDGTKTGIKRAFVNNIRLQILSCEDRVDVYTEADFGLPTQRVTMIEYTSPAFPGITVRRTFSYTLVGNKYRRDQSHWTVV